MGAQNAGMMPRRIALQGSRVLVLTDVLSILRLKPSLHILTDMLYKSSKGTGVGRMETGDVENRNARKWKQGRVIIYVWTASRRNTLVGQANWTGIHTF